MIDLLRDILGWGLILLGSLAVVVGAVGLVRFPDFYTRLHAAGVTDTAGAELILFGLMFMAPSWIVVAKLAFISFFLFLTSPVSTHAIAHAAWVVGLKPMLGPDLKRSDADNETAYAATDEARKVSAPGGNPVTGDAVTGHVEPGGGKA